MNLRLRIEEGIAERCATTSDANEGMEGMRSGRGEEVGGGGEEEEGGRR